MEMLVMLVLLLHAVHNIKLALNPMKMYNYVTTKVLKIRPPQMGQPDILLSCLDALIIGTSRAMMKNNGGSGQPHLPPHLTEKLPTYPHSLSRLLWFVIYSLYSVELCSSYA